MGREGKRKGGVDKGGREREKSRRGRIKKGGRERKVVEEEVDRYARKG